MEIKSFIKKLLRLRGGESSFEKIEHYSGDKFFVWPYKDLKCLARRSDFPIIKEIFYRSSISTLNKIDTISMEFYDVEGSNNTGLKLAEYLNNIGFEFLEFEYDPTHLDLNFGKLIVSKRL